MNIFQHELKVNFKSTIMWICTLCGIATMMMFFYPAIKNDMDLFTNLLDDFPDAVKAAMGIMVENFSSPLGFYGFAFTYSMLFGAIQAMTLGIGIVSKEQRERTADFLLTKPVSRVKILTAKLLSVLTLLVMTNLVYSAITALLISGFSDGNFEFQKLALINFSLFFSQLIFFSIGLMISICAKKIKSVLPISLGLVFMFFAISAFAVTSTDDKLRLITPFQYFKMDYILANGHYDALYAIIGLFVIMIGIVLSYILYKRKDIDSV